MRIKNTLNNKGQSLVEVIMSIGVVVLVITGVIVLIVATVGIKNNSFDRKKATQMAGVVLENLTKKKNEDPESFWQLSSTSNGTVANFPGFTYNVGFTVVNDVGVCVDAGSTRCANAEVTVLWKDNKAVNVNRFFLRGE